MIAASTGPHADATRALTLCKSLARLTAIGLQNAHLRSRHPEFATQQDPNRDKLHLEN